MTTCKATLCVALALTMLLSETTAPAQADFTYDLTINTAGLSGTPGSLDIQFNPTSYYLTPPGNGTPTATVQALSGNDTTFGSVTYTAGNVAGPGNSTPTSGLPLYFSAYNSGPNAASYNEVTMNVTFGTTTDMLALSVNITTPDNISTASLFVALYDQNGNNISPIPNSSNFPSQGQAIEIDLYQNPTGSTPTPTAHTGQGATANVLPEPTLGVLLVQGLACLFVVGLIRRKRLAVAA